MPDNLLMPEGSDPYYGQRYMPSQSLSAYQPTLRDRFATWLMGDGRPSPERAGLIEGLTGSRGMGTTGMGLLDATPAGVPFAVQDAYRSGDDRQLAMAIMPGPAKSRMLSVAEEKALRPKPIENIIGNIGQHDLVKRFDPFHSETSYHVRNGTSEIGRAVYNADEGWINWVYVNPNYQRQGIGTQLYDAIEKDTGKKLTPSYELIDEPSYRFWMKRDPEALLTRYNERRYPEQVAEIRAAIAQKQQNTSGIRAYHGSPHDFVPEVELERVAPGKLGDMSRIYQDARLPIPDGYKVTKQFPHGRFDINKIGTGEGAQSYGHGLYFAEAEDVARQYRDALKAKALIDDNAPMHDPKRIAGELYDSYRGDIAGAFDDAKYYDNSKEIIAALKEIEKNPPTGRLYEVRINADPVDFLDLDKGISEQPAKLQSALKEAIGKFRTDLDPIAQEIWGERFGTLLKSQRQDVYDLASKRGIAIDQDAAESWRGMLKDPKSTEFLRDSGIPGLKYFDAGSRDIGEGSRNYVVFRDDIIDIVKKYGIAAAASMYGMDAVNNAMGAANDQPQNLLMQGY